MEIAPYITVDPKIHHGSPVITGTRVPVSIVIGSLAGGMSKEEVDKIFLPHFRANNNANIGHGVGLTIVKRLSERFNWPLKVASSPNDGTRIEVIFIYH